jgi:tetratricopeptide (TPR) repeat protein
MRNQITRIVFIVIGLLVLAVAVYNIPFVNEKLAWRLDDLRAQIVSFFRPPEAAVFQPGSQQSVTGTLPPPQVRITTGTPEASPTSSGPTPTPSITPTPLPLAISLPGVKYVDQKNRWNYCGPANLTMALNFWGWKGDRDDVAMVVKPGFYDPSKDFISRGRLDLNVMPYEMADFVTNHTDYAMVVRHGGEIDLLKGLIAAGLPVVIEKGYYERDTQGKHTWMGHYLFVTGYDDSQEAFIVQDAYYLDKEDPRKNVQVKFDAFVEGWRAFNYLFMVVYPPEREQNVYSVLGNWGDPHWSDEHALAMAESDVATTQELNSFFAWFNKGTSHVQLQQYNDAATAYDQAFSIYAGLEQDNNTRPYRMVWYQTGPYWAYFYTGRYQDVINLANVTLSTPSTGPTLEESLYWRAMASYALGDTVSAFNDMREAVRLNPNFSAGLTKLQEWSVN